MNQPKDNFDIVVIGSGVNGAGIARDLAGRGVRVLLLEAGDLARGTSSASSKLIHGGLRYLEHYEFGLVRDALGERERLWSIAPHIIWPLRFVLPLVGELRARWLLRLGLLFYDHIGRRRKLPPTQSIKLDSHPAGAPLKPQFTYGFAYSDCWVDDSRLVVLNVRDAADRGADVRTRCQVERLERVQEKWQLTTSQGRFTARAVVNAAGPAVLGVLASANEYCQSAIRLVRGSHIVLPKLFDHPHPYFFQLPDGRVIFAIPYERDFTLIGTTDREHLDGDPLEASDDEIAYLCDGANRFFQRPVRPGDVLWSFAGVRALVDGGSGKPEAATRGYQLELSEVSKGAPILSVFGGKITTYRRLAQEAVNLLAERLPELSGPSWTETEPLPGGNFPLDGQPALLVDLMARHEFLEPAWADRLVKAYGTFAVDVVSGVNLGHGMTEGEVRYLQQREWAVTAEDILWRRTKLGLRFSSEQRQALDRFLAEHDLA